MLTADGNVTVLQVQRGRLRALLDRVAFARGAAWQRQLIEEVRIVSAEIRRLKQPVWTGDAGPMVTNAART